MQRRRERRHVSSDEDLAVWVRLKNAVVPNEPVTLEQLHAHEEGRLLLLAELGGTPVGCGIARRSHLAGRGFVAARVLPKFRRQGIGTVLLLALGDHVRSIGRAELTSFVYADDPGSVAFAGRFGHEVDYRLEQIREVGIEQPVNPPRGITLEALEGRREEVLPAAWPLALEGLEDMPLSAEVTVEREEWLREEATRLRGPSSPSSEVRSWGTRVFSSARTIPEWRSTVSRLCAAITVVAGLGTR